MRESPWRLSHDTSYNLCKMSHRVSVVLTRKVHGVAKIYTITRLLASLNTQLVDPRFLFTIRGAPTLLGLITSVGESSQARAIAALLSLSKNLGKTASSDGSGCASSRWCDSHQIMRVVSRKVLLTKLRESRLGVATYMTCQLKRSCNDRVSELGGVELIG